MRLEMQLWEVPLDGRFEHGGYIHRRCSSIGEYILVDSHGEKIRMDRNTVVRWILPIDLQQLKQMIKELP